MAVLAVLCATSTNSGMFCLLYQMDPLRGQSTITGGNFIFLAAVCSQCAHVFHSLAADFLVPTMSFFPLLVSAPQVLRRIPSCHHFSSPNELVRVSTWLRQRKAPPVCRNLIEILLGRKL